MVPDVRFGSKADMCTANTDVRFGPIADIKTRRLACPLAAACRPVSPQPKATSLPERYGGCRISSPLDRIVSERRESATGKDNVVHASEQQRCRHAHRASVSNDYGEIIIVDEGPQHDGDIGRA